MQKSFTKQLISLILAVCFTLAFPALSFAADSNQSDGEAKSESIYNEFKKSDGELICVSKYGDTDKPKPLQRRQKRVPTLFTFR